MKCLHCGCSNPEHLRFCQDCGKPQAGSSPGEDKPPRASEVERRQHAAASCGHCGSALEERAAFCPNCGRAVAAAPSGETASARSDQREGILASGSGPSCPLCTSQNPPRTDYCLACGAKLASDGPSFTASSPPVSHRAATVPSVTSAERPQQTAELVVIGHDGVPGRRFPLTDNQTDLGRTEGGIQLRHDPYVCPRHARFLSENGTLCVSDLASVNGIYLRIRGGTDLLHGDLVLLGLEVLRFEVVNDTYRAPASQGSSGADPLAEGRLAGEVVHGFEPAWERGTRVFGSPGAPRYARLCQRTVEGITRNVHYVCGARTTIGREEGDLLFAQDPFMSRRHASVERDPDSGRFVLRDLNSSNGTFLALRGRTELRSGDHLRIGQHLFRVETGRAEPR